MSDMGSGGMFLHHRASGNLCTNDPAFGRAHRDDGSVAKALSWPDGHSLSLTISIMA